MIKNSLNYFKKYFNNPNLIMKCYGSTFSSIPNNEILKNANINPSILK